MCAWYAPRSVATTPVPHDPSSPMCGECGSCSLSACWWCLRCVPAHWITGPWTAIDPKAAKRYRTGAGVANDLCVASRWNPTVTPTAVASAIPVMIQNCVQSNAAPQLRTIPAASANNGTVTAARLMSLSFRSAGESTACSGG
jgi:hypothetical protein